MTLAAGVDVGAGAIKAAVFERTGRVERLLGLATRTTRHRDPTVVTREVRDLALREAGVAEGDLDYVATTGHGGDLPWATGHFYGLTTHARGALFLEPDARAVLDGGDLHLRAMKMDERGKVLESRISSQCAAGTGQFLATVARHLGVHREDVGPMSRRATGGEMVSSTCAVLAETEVVNLVSRGIPPENILKGIHLAMAMKFAGLLRSVGADGLVLITGGLSTDVGLLDAVRQTLPRKARRLDVEVRSHEQGIFAGAIGAALWGVWRHDYLTSRMSI